MHHIKGHLVVLEAARPHQFIFRMELLYGVRYTNTTQCHYKQQCRGTVKEHMYMLYNVHNPASSNKEFLMPSNLLIRNLT